jgi:AraC-like DNA-binding protein
VHEQPASKHGTDYFKIGFDEECLSLLPRQYPFLIDPLNSQKITFNTEVASRLQSVFYMLTQLLKDWNAPSELVLAYLNSLLTEINAAYFAAQRKVSDAKLSKYIDFKIFIENNLTDHPTISQVAEALAVNTNGLYHIVKHYSGLSPKEFIINRLIIEARRRLYYTKGSSVKDLAFELGFNDPEYFSRLFKKVTGKTITGFFHDLSGN